MAQYDACDGAAHALAAADIIRRDARLNAIYLANFGCVNDSMYPRFFGREMGEKPFLLLEIDEHSAEAGVVTRCEAFLDAVANFDAAREIAPRRTRKIEFDPGGDRVLYLAPCRQRAWRCGPPRSGRTASTPNSSRRPTSGASNGDGAASTGRNACPAPS